LNGPFVIGFAANAFGSLKKASGSALKVE